MKVYMFKMVSGENVVAMVVSEPHDLQVEKSFVLKKAVKFSNLHLPTNKGIQSIVIPEPWLFTENMGEVTVKVKDIMAIDVNVPAELEQKYLQMTTDIDLTSKIQL